MSFLPQFKSNSGQNKRSKNNLKIERVNLRQESVSYCTKYNFILYLEKIKTNMLS